MGSCFSKRKFLSDAAVTHNASPRTSCASKEFTEQGFTFGTNKEAEGATDFPGTKTLNKKKKSKSPCSLSNPEQQYINSAMDDRRSFAPASPSPLPSSAAESLRANSSPSNALAVSEGTGRGALRSVEELRLSPSPPSSTTKDATLEFALALRAAPAPAIIFQDNTPGAMKQPALRQSRSTNGTHSQVYSCAQLVPKGESPSQATMVTGNGVDETNTKPASTNSKLKRSRSYEHSMRLDDAKRPLRNIFHRQEDEEDEGKDDDGGDTEEKIAPRRFSDGVVLPCQFAPHSGGRGNGVKCSKFLEGLDLIDLHPSKPTTNLIDQAHYQGFSALQFSSSTSSDHSHAEDHARISADFLELKHRYLSSRSSKSASSSCRQVDDDRVAHTEDDDGKMRRNSLHARSCSMDSSAERGYYSFHRNYNLRIGAVAEEESCGSDDSDDETFEFKQAVSLFSRENVQIYEQKQQQMLLQQQQLHRQPIAEGQEGQEEEDEEEEEGNKYEGVSVVSTGDAVLVSGSKSRELHLIPSKAYFHESSSVSGSSRLTEATNAGATTSSSCYALVPAAQGQVQGQQQMGSLSVEEIIKLLERDELDEEVLLSLFSVSMAGGGGSRNYSSGGGGGGTTPPSADAMSEASFEFKLVSTGSTPPHSTPSTPMLSAGSTPTRRHVTQLSPLALTSEEIAEIWGVFEQRQSLVS